IDLHASYIYWIRNRNACGAGAFSDGLACVVPSEPLGPATAAASTGANCNATETGILVTWASVTAYPSVLTYRVYRDFVQIASVLGTDPPSYWDTDVQAGGHYTYYIRAVNGCGFGDFSETVEGVAVPHSGLSAG